MNIYRTKHGENNYVQKTSGRMAEIDNDLSQQGLHPKDMQIFRVKYA